MSKAVEGLRVIVLVSGVSIERRRFAYRYGAVLRNLGKLRGERGIFRGLIGVISAIPGLLYTSDAADERSSVDLGGRRIIKKKKNMEIEVSSI